MSTLIIESCKIDAIRPHNNADSIEIAIIKGWQTVVKKGEFKIGDNVIYFPPDSIIPEHLAEQYGVKNYLGQSHMGLKVKAARLRGEASYGFVVKTDLPEGTDCKDLLGIKKYEPPFVPSEGDCASPHPLFHPYTDIENIRNFPGLIKDGEEVVFTEKIHGQNYRVGLINDEFMVGSRKTQKKQGNNDWWNLLHDKHYELLKYLGSNTILFGEKFGVGVQDMHYGLKGQGLRFFDICQNLKYLDYDKKEELFKKFDIETVPILYRGSFSLKVVEEYTSGPTNVCDPKIAGKFSGREGIVITKTKNEFDRTILKSISVDYLGRKNPVDN